jgi:azurin
MRQLAFLSGLLLLVALVGCGDSESAPDATETASPSTTVDRTVTLHPKGNLLKYEETEFTVAPGETIKLVFENTATSESMLHNVVVLNDAPRKELLWRIGEAGVEAGEANEYVPDDDAILAYTPMADPGETVSVTFTVPEETGDYGYLCTFPGHYVTMYGTMHVTAEAPA